MQQQLTLSHGVSYLGLLIILGTGILSTAVGVNSGYGLPLMMLTGAGMTLGGRLWHYRLRRATRLTGDSGDLGGYPLSLLRDPHFTTGRRVA